MGFKRRSSVEISSIPLVELRSRLASLALSPAARSLILDAEIDPLLVPDDDAWNAQFTAVVVRGGWSAPVARPLISANEHPSVVVFEDGLSDPEVSLVLDYEELLGVARKADQAAIVFLGPVHCRDVCTVADSLVVFAAGLSVERFACFDGPRTHTHVDHHLIARGVVSSSAYVGKQSDVRVEALCGYIGGLPRRSVRKVGSVGELWPEFAGSKDDAHLAIARFLRSSRSHA